MIKLVQLENDYMLIQVTLTEASLIQADAFKEQLIRLLDHYKKNLIIDLQQVKYIDSSFLGALVAVLKHAMVLNTELVLAGLKKDIYNMIALIRLDKVFKIYNTLPDAVQAFA